MKKSENFIQIKTKFKFVRKFCSVFWCRPFYILLCLLCLGLSGCGFGFLGSEGSKHSGGVVGTKTYTVRGQTYRPLISAEGFLEEGIASWYGKDFHGKKTANGEIYDMYGVTAAHKLLPFNTRVRVTNLDNGRQTVVRINDRGPFVSGRIIDLTHTTASNIGMLGPGIARVRVETVGTVAAIKNDDLLGNFYIQVGAFAQKSNAQGLRDKLIKNGQKARIYFSDMVGFWRVQIGPFPSLKQAENKIDTLQGAFPGSFIVAD